MVLRVEGTVVVQRRVALPIRNCLNLCERIAQLGKVVDFTRREHCRAVTFLQGVCFESIGVWHAFFGNDVFYFWRPRHVRLKLLPELLFLLSRQLHLGQSFCFSHLLAELGDLWVVVHVCLQVRLDSHCIVFHFLWLQIHVQLDGDLLLQLLVLVNHSFGARLLLKLEKAHVSETLVVVEDIGLVKRHPQLLETAAQLGFARLLLLLFQAYSN